MNMQCDEQKEIPMSSVSQIAQSLQEVLEERADILAKETGFIQRVRTFSGADFAQTLIFGWLQEPQVTLEGLSQIMQRRQVSISGPGLCQRFSPESACFMQRLLEEVTHKQFEAEPVPIALLRRFSAVLLEDSCAILLPESLAPLWQGCGGSPGTSSAALKLFVRWDVLTGTLEGPVLTDGRHSDRRSPLDVQEEADGSLLIADLGFWGVARFAQMARRRQPRQKRRYFLSRLQSGVKLRRRNGSEIVLRGILTEIYGKLTAMVIQQWLLQEGCWQDPKRSLVKAAQVVRREANLLMRALTTGELEAVLGDILRCMRSGCRTNTRQQFPSTSQFLMGEPHRWPVSQENTACSLLPECVWGRD
jgi:hypothetical protein